MPDVFNQWLTSKTANYLLNQDIPTGAGPYKDVFTKDTTVFSVFIPMFDVEEGKCVLPNYGDDNNYLQHLIRHANFFKSRGMKYTLASDSRHMTPAQWDNLKEIGRIHGIDLFDLATILNNLTFKEAKAQGYFKLLPREILEYIDRAKLLLMDLAGNNGIGNVLILNPDMVFEPSSRLEIPAYNDIAFTYTKRHPKLDPNFNVENSMIYVSGKPRPTSKDGSDCIKSIIKMSDLYYAPSDGAEGRIENEYLSVFYSLIAHDTILKIQGIVSSPHLAHDNYSANSRKNNINSIVSSGDYVLRGKYYSFNVETWSIEEFTKTTAFYSFDESLNFMPAPFHRQDSFSEQEMHKVKEHLLSCNEESLLLIHKFYPEWVKETFDKIDELVLFLIQKPRLAKLISSQNSVLFDKQFLNQVSFSTFVQLLVDIPQGALICSRLGEDVLKSFLTKEHLKEFFKNASAYSPIVNLCRKFPFISELIRSEMGYSDYAKYNGLDQLSDIVGVPFEDMKPIFYPKDFKDAALDPLLVTIFCKSVEDLIRFVEYGRNCDDIVRQHGNLIIKSEQDLKVIREIKPDLAKIFDKFHGLEPFAKRLKPS